MTTPPPADEGRLARLRSGVARLRSRGGPPRIGRILMIAGGGLAGLGVALIVLGWIGAAHTPYVFEQVPYLISGGLLGVALALLGGLSYFAYWMTRALEEGRAQSDRTQDALRRIEELLAGSANGAAAGARANGSPFVKTEKGTMFHRPECSVVAGREDLRLVAAGGEGFEPCKICDPVASL